METDWSFFGSNDANGDWKLNPQFLQTLAQIGTGMGKGQNVGQSLGEAAATALRMQALQGKNPQVVKPTPKGSPGPDSITTTETADGTTTTIKTPSERNLNTYGNSVPPETLKTPTNGGVSDQSPFWKALLGPTS